VNSLTAELLVALKATLEWMEHTIPQLHATCPHCDKRVDVGGMNWGGPISKARAAIAHAESGIELKQESTGHWYLFTPGRPDIGPFQNHSFGEHAARVIRHLDRNFSDWVFQAYGMQGAIAAYPPGGPSADNYRKLGSVAWIASVHGPLYVVSDVKGGQ
jgi:hypothetical protein